MPETREMLLEKRRKLEDDLIRLDEHEKAVLREMDIVDEQIEYYRALIKDMKKAISPPLFTRLMNAIGGR